MIKDMNFDKIPVISKTIIDIYKYEKKNPIEFSQKLPEIIAKDPGLTSKILKIANSPYYGLIGKISTISHAINLLGVETVKNIALRSSFTDMYLNLKKDKNLKVAYTYFLKRGLISGIFSKIICETLGLGNPESFLLRGTLSKIGNIALIMKYKNKYDFDIENTDDSVLVELEREKFGTDFIEVGKYLVEQWNFPYEFYLSIDNQIDLKHKDNISNVAYLSNLFSKLLLIKNEELRNEMIRDFKTKLKEIFDLNFSDFDTFKSELELEIKLFIESAPEFNNDCEDIIKVFEKIHNKLIEDIKNIEEVNKKLIKVKNQLLWEKKFLKFNLRFAKSLVWINKPDQIIVRLLHHIAYMTKQTDTKFIYWDNESKQFYVFRLNESKVEKYVYDLKKAPLYEKAYKLRELQIKNFDDSILIAIPVFFETTSFGVISLFFKDKTDYSIELVNAIETTANIVANALNNYYSNMRVKKEIVKKYVMFEEIKNGMFDNKKMKELIKELQLYNIHKYILRSIIHKLNNKLTPVIGYAQMLETKINEEKTRGRLSVIRENSNEVVNILNRLFEQFSTPVFKEEIINLNMLIKEKIQLIDYKIKAEGIKIKYELDESIPNMFFSRVQISDVIMNLIVNSIEALKISDKQEKNIIIKTSYNAPLYHIEVIDNGIGIEDKHKDKIFEPFFSTFKDKSGLGLNFVHGFVNANQGSVEIESKKNIGTKIIISFYAKTIEKQKTERISKENYKILIVDDEESLVELITEFLHYEGIDNIVSAQNGEEAMEKIKNNSFDLIITDIRMPKISGIELYKWLKKEGKKIDLFFITANTASEELDNIIINDKIPVLTKPFSLMEFTGLVYEFINNKKLEV